jgi:predicted phage terminase large subunit-like protein
MDQRTTAIELQRQLHKLPPEKREEVENFIFKTLTATAKNNFYDYLRIIAPLMIPEDFKDGRHLEIYCNELQKAERAVAEGRKYKLQFELPPGAMKSLTLCIWLSWCLGRHPKWYVIAKGGTFELATDNYGEKLRSILMLPEFCFIFTETKISKTTRAKHMWNTTLGGRFRAAGALQNVQGKRAHIIVCDDLIGENTPKSEVTKICSKYVIGVRSRLLPTGSAEVIVNTRWSLNDLSGYIIKVDELASATPWVKISIPAILTGEKGEAAAKLLGLPVGGSYWPEYWPLENFESTRRTLPEWQWNALYMQNPTPEEGNKFKRKNFNFWDEIENSGFPEFTAIYLSMDTAFSESQRADNSAWGVYGIRESWVTSGNSKRMKIEVFLMEAGKDKLSYPELVMKAKSLNTKYHLQGIVIENKASGQSLIQDLVFQGLPVIPYEPKGDKLLRASLTAPFLEQGIFYLPTHAGFAKDFLSELLEFPSGEYDDQVDQFTQLVLYLRDAGVLTFEGYGGHNNDSDEDEDVKPPVKTYWSAIKGR